MRKEAILFFLFLPISVFGQGWSEELENRPNITLFDCSTTITGTNLSNNLNLFVRLILNKNHSNAKLSIGYNLGGGRGSGFGIYKTGALSISDDSKIHLFTKTFNENQEVQLHEIVNFSNFNMITLDNSTSTDVNIEATFILSEIKSVLNNYIMSSQTIESQVSLPEHFNQSNTKANCIVSSNHANKISSFEYSTILSKIELLTQGNGGNVDEATISFITNNQGARVSYIHIWSEGVIRNLML